MKKGKITKITVCISAVLLIMVLLMGIYAIICQSEMTPIIVGSEPVMEKTGYLTVQKGQEESEALMTESERDGVVEDDMAAVCEMMRAMDFTVEHPQMELTEEEDRAYREAFLRLLKNELPIKGRNEGEDRYQNLWWAGIPYEELLEERDSEKVFYSYYYDDIDGDGKPKFGVNQQAVYFFDYELGEDACSISYCGQNIYFEGVLGVGKMWEHDVQHAWVERFRYIVLNGDGEWETVLDLERGYGEPNYYEINGVDVGQGNWEELTAPFFEVTEHEVPTKTLAEVFGELLDAN